MSLELCGECGGRLSGDPRWPPCGCIPPRLDLVARIRAGIAAGEYHMGTLEGDLATNLTADKLMQELEEGDQ